jgi:hypothetical protein
MLEEDDNFRRWVESLERGSVLTASVYFRRMGHLCASMKVTPAGSAGSYARTGPMKMADAAMGIRPVG